MASFSIDKDDVNASQVMDEMEMSTLEDPLDSFESANPMIKKARGAKKDLEEQVKKLTLSVDTQKVALDQAKKDLSEVDQQVGKIQARLTMAKGFRTKTSPSSSEKAFISSIPADELALEQAKKDQAEAKKRVTEATRVLGREEPNLTQAKLKLENFNKTFEFLGVSMEDSGPSLSSTLLSSSSLPAQSEAGSHSNHSSLLQMNDDCLMPSYESKAIIQKTPKKILQELEKRLLFAPALELDAELAALSELQTAIQPQKDLQAYGEKLLQIKNQCQANRGSLNRLTLAKLLAKLLPVAARQTLHLSLMSLKDNPRLKKELCKPALYDSRAKLGLLLQNERKFDISGEWKGREAFTLKACRQDNSRGRGGRGGANRGRGRGRGGYRDNNRSDNRSRSQKPLAKLSRFELRKQGRCFRCRQKGHMGKDCPEAKDEQKKQ